MVSRRAEAAVWRPRHWSQSIRAEPGVCKHDAALGASKLLLAELGDFQHFTFQWPRLDAFSPYTIQDAIRRSDADCGNCWRPVFSRQRLRGRNFQQLRPRLTACARPLVGHNPWLVGPSAHNLLARGVHPQP